MIILFISTVQKIYLKKTSETTCASLEKNIPFIKNYITDA